MQPYSAIVLGSTGNVGRQIVVSDLDKLAETVETAVREADVTVGLCAIGVGKGSQKMSEDAVRKIEVQYPEAFARGCKAGGVVSLGLMTAAGADLASAFRYVRIIGEKEKAVLGIGIPTLGVYKPSVIFGNSNTPSYLHYLYPVVQWVLPSRYHAIHKTQLARAMVEGTQQALAELQEKRAAGGTLPTPVVRSYEYADMKPFFD